MFRLFTVSLLFYNGVYISLILFTSLFSQGLFFDYTLLLRAYTFFKYIVTVYLLYDKHAKIVVNLDQVGIKLIRDAWIILTHVVDNTAKSY